MNIRLSNTTQKVLALGIIFLLWAVSQYLNTSSPETGRSKVSRDRSIPTEPQKLQSPPPQALQLKDVEKATLQSDLVIPIEARKTIELIRKGGPFLHEHDGVTFYNRERMLPQKPKGYYREYTVSTPGLRHRGARRIVTGEGGELYYTDDHYRTFTKLAPP